MAMCQHGSSGHEAEVKRTWYGQPAEWTEELSSVQRCSKITAAPRAGIVSLVWLCPVPAAGAGGTARASLSRLWGAADSYAECHGHQIQRCCHWPFSKSGTILQLE